MDTWWIVKDSFNNEPYIISGVLSVYHKEAIGPYWSYGEARGMLNYWSKHIY